MTDYASLTLWRKLNNRSDSLYHTLHKLDQAGKMMEAIESLYPQLEDRQRFGSVSFQEIGTNVYYSHIPGDSLKQLHQLECDNFIEPEWLLCFTSNQFKTRGSELIAEATVKCALNNLSRLTLKNKSDDALLFEQRKLRLIEWITRNARSEDVISLRSNIIFYDWSGNKGHKGNQAIEIMNRSLEFANCTFLES